MQRQAVFLFFIFVLKNIYFRFGNLQEYTPAARQRGGRGFYAKNFAQIIARRSLGVGRPAAGRPAPPGRSATGRPALPPLYKGWLVPRPSFTSLKFQKPRKERERVREGERRRPLGFSSRRLQVTKILLRFTNRLYCNYFC